MSVIISLDKNIDNFRNANKTCSNQNIWWGL
jgi:hypothetical protein